MAEIARLDTSREQHDDHNVTVRRRVQPRQVVIMGAALFMVAFGAWWLFDRLSNVYVVDARVAAEMVLISSRVPGWLVAVPVSEGAQVARGDVLLHIDEREAKSRRDELDLAVHALEADAETTGARIAQVEARTTSRRDAAEARLAGAESALTSARSEHEMAQSGWQRADALRERNLVSQQEWESVRNHFRTAAQDIKRNEAIVATATADVLEVEAERTEIAVLRSQLKSLAATLSQKKLEAQRASAHLGDHSVKSPIDGTVDELFVDAGEYVAVGQRVLAMHDQSRQWIKANVKETDLIHIKPGAAVEVTVDAYPDAARSATIRRVGRAATSQFALMPNPNPSGNFTKVAQRVEVVIDLDEPDPRLLPGMMVEVKVPRSGR